jgi:hypothetical protein
MSHDQLFKDLLSTFFHDFLTLFMPDIADGIDPASIVFRNPELFTDLPTGERRMADLLAEVRTVDGQPRVILIHTEIQAKRGADFGYRMWEYHAMIKLRDSKPLISIAVQLSSGTSGISLESYEETLFGITYRYLMYWQVGLRDLDAPAWITAAPQLVAALGALMRPGPEGRAALKLALLRRIMDSGLDDARVFLLVNAVETYLELDAADQAMLRASLNAEGEEVMEATELTWADKILIRGREEGLEQGALEARRQIARRLVLRRFSAVPADVENHITSASAETLDRMLDQIVTVSSVDELLNS